jgi:putative restriction endonuclease
MFKEAFSKHIHAANVDGSKKAASYIRALDLLIEMLKAEPFGFSDCENIWKVNSVERLQELYIFVLMESKKGDESAWNIKGIPTSYLQNKEEKGTFPLSIYSSLLKATRPNGSNLVLLI